MIHAALAIAGMLQAIAVDDTLQTRAVTVADLQGAGLNVGALLICEQMGYTLNRAGAVQYVEDAYAEAEARGMPLALAQPYLTSAANGQSDRDIAELTRLEELATLRDPGRYDAIIEFAADKAKFCATIGDDPKATRMFSSKPPSTLYAAKLLASRLGLVPPAKKARK